MRPAVCLALLLAAGSRPARADGVVEELSAGTTPQAASAPSSSWLTDKLAGIWEPGDDWQIRIDLAGTRYFHIRADDLAVANLSVEYDAGAHWIARLAAGGSPASSIDSAVPVKAVNARGNPIAGDATLVSTTSSLSGSAWLGYETAGDGDAETTANLGASVTALTSREQIASIAGRNGQTITLDQVRAFCAMQPCQGGLGAALDGTTTPLHQLVVTAGLSELLFQVTELGVDGAYYFYDQDPAQVGTLSITRAGQTMTSGGIGIAPVRYSVTPSVIQRIGPVMVMGSAAYSKYVDSLGWAVDAALRVQIKLPLGDTRLKLWAKLTGSRDVDQMSTVSKAGSVALGTQYTLVGILRRAAIAVRPCEQPGHAASWVPFRARCTSTTGMARPGMPRDRAVPAARRRSSSHDATGARSRRTLDLRETFHERPSRESGTAWYRACSSLTTAASSRPAEAPGRSCHARHARRDVRG